MTVRSQSLRAGTLASLALAAGTVTALLLAGREPARFSGRIEAQTAFVNAAHAGIVAELLVKEGDHVSLEHPLATLTDPELDARIAGLSGHERAFVETRLERKDDGNLSGLQLLGLQLLSTTKLAGLADALVNCAFSSQPRR